MTVVFGLFHGLVFLPAMLSVIGKVLKILLLRGKMYTLGCPYICAKKDK